MPTTDQESPLGSYVLCAGTCRSIYIEGYRRNVINSRPKHKHKLVREFQVLSRVPCTLYKDDKSTRLYTGIQTMLMMMIMMMICSIELQKINQNEDHVNGEITFRFQLPVQRILFLWCVGFVCTVINEFGLAEKVLLIMVMDDDFDEDIVKRSILGREKYKKKLSLWCFGSVPS